MELSIKVTSNGPGDVAVAIDGYYHGCPPWVAEFRDQELVGCDDAPDWKALHTLAVAAAKLSPEWRVAVNGEVAMGV